MKNLRIKRLIQCVLILAIATLFIFQSCTKDGPLNNPEIPNLGGYNPEGDPLIDAWISENLTTPFNVAVKYQYDPFEIDYTKNTVPPKKEFVIPIMEMVLKCMAGPYIEVSDSVFMKTVMPKTWVLIGSVQYNNDGTVLLGQAEGANKITIMDINRYELKESFIKTTNRTIQHETAHILHQTRIYDPNFKLINPEKYTTTWFNIPDKDANKEGFVRNYAMYTPDEDFVETIAFLLVYGQTEYNKLVTNASAEGKTRLLLKEKYVVDYFNDKWDIDFRQLQVLVKKSMDDYLKGL